MTRDADAVFRCPKCGATSALLLPEPFLRESHVTLKCLQCAHVLRLSRSRLESAIAPYDSTSSLE